MSLVGIVSGTGSDRGNETNLSDRLKVGDHDLWGNNLSEGQIRSVLLFGVPRPSPSSYVRAKPTSGSRTAVGGGTDIRTVVGIHAQDRKGEGEGLLTMGGPDCKVHWSYIDHQTRVIGIAEVHPHSLGSGDRTFYGISYTGARSGNEERGRLLLKDPTIHG